MNERGGRTRGRIAVLTTAVAMFGLVVATAATANNLDRRTMTSVAKQVAKTDCRDTRGCKDWAVRGLHRVSRHKALGKIVVDSQKDGTNFRCTRQIVIKLDHTTGELAYGVSRRRCEQIT
jgi:hypothetical protein